jgi:hypothetical protein
MPPPMGLRNETSRALQLHRLTGERKRLERELELVRQRLRTVQTRLQEVDAQVADLEGRPLAPAIRSGLDAPQPARDNRPQLTVEY